MKTQHYNTYSGGCSCCSNDMYNVHINVWDWHKHVLHELMAVNEKKSRTYITNIRVSVACIWWVCGFSSVFRRWKSDTVHFHIVNEHSHSHCADVVLCCVCVELQRVHVAKTTSNNAINAHIHHKHTHTHTHPNSRWYTHNPFNNKISTKWKFPPRKHINIPSTL